MVSSILLSLCIVMFTVCNSFPVTPPEKVRLDLYYESFCPTCFHFMINDLTELFRNGLISFVDIHLVPYGNARLENGNIICSHGDYECKLNMVEACAIHAWPNVYEHYYFIYCVERLVAEDRHTEWESCYHETGFDQKPITNCLNSPLGKQLSLRCANETASLKPSHQFVPWVVVNGKPLKEDFPKFINFICRAFLGTPPYACFKL